MAELLHSELPSGMTVDAFLVWAEGRPGRHELELGRVIATAPERASHNRAKTAAQRALADAVARAGISCESFSDGMTVRVDRMTAYEPDAVVHCGPSVPPDAIEVPHPVVEVVSPSSGSRDHDEKLVGYFLVPSIRHYLIVHPDRRILVHHARDGDSIRTRILDGGALRLDPPGLELSIEDLFGGRPETAAHGPAS